MRRVLWPGASAPYSNTLSSAGLLDNRCISSLVAFLYLWLKLPRTGTNS